MGGLSKWTEFLKANPGLTTTEAANIYTPIPKVVSNGIHGNSLLTTKPAQGYILFDRRSGEVVKFGETTLGKGRYTKDFLKSENVTMKFVNQGSKADMRKWETASIKKYEQRHGHKPRLNKCYH